MVPDQSAGLPPSSDATVPALLEEEVGEFVAASERGFLVGIADALANILYVAYGTALTYGIEPGHGLARGAKCGPLAKRSIRKPTQRRWLIEARCAT